MRVYDLILSEGLEGAILKFGMAVVQRNASTLLGKTDMLALTNFLKERLFDVYIDQTPSSKSILESGFFGHSGGSDTEVYRADILVQDACAVRITSDMLNRYRLEWEEKVKTEKDRETELETLRTTAATQAAQIRLLEERTQKSDAEHVQIASELVRMKVENEELRDRNESLAGQVEELRKVADNEAKVVEEKLKAEMNRVMQRNIEVQNENRHMEEAMAEMEKDLVETKMKYAEVSIAPPAPTSFVD
jgi:predicted  nucleic acid-binding Zn-ribbon protein